MLERGNTDITSRTSLLCVLKFQGRTGAVQDSKALLSS